MKKHIVESILPDSIAEECGFEKGDALLAINDNPIEDTFDYQYLIADDFLVLKVETRQGEIVEVEVEKDPGEDLGLVFENSFMDNYRSCKNKCIFCFIDQMPPGMRETLYFKDDDTRLSFLQGNYVTLTNLSDEDIARIIKYRMEPLNVSFQTMNPELRCKMLHNRFAGEELKKATQLYEVGIEMNGQIVLCKGVNDGKELEFSLQELYKYLPVLQSVSVVPVGLSKYREGLYPLEPFNKEDALEVIEMIERWQNKAFKKYGTHFVHASDEWYLLAGLPLPEEERYDGYLQFENGVGMVRSFIVEFEDLFREKFGMEAEFPEVFVREEELGIPPSDDTVTETEGADGASDVRFDSDPETVISFATGRLFGPILKACCDNLERVYPNIKIHVYEIRNDFFGEMITVAGLITGTDLIAQLKEKEIGETLILPDTMFRFQEDILLDDVRVTEVESALHCRVDIVKSNGMDLIDIVSKYAEK